MLSIAKIGAGGAAEGLAAYHEQEASQARAEDYYQSEAAGQWKGALADALGLHGEIQKGELLRVLQGFHPQTGKPLAKNAGPEHKAGWDCTFSAPKSVSIVWALADHDQRRAIEGAQARAVEAALAYLEQHAFTSRSRQEPEQITRTLSACYQHGASREGDPQLHTHAIIQNIGIDSAGRPCALEFDLRHKMAAGALYRAELAAQLQELGYQTERDGDAFKLVGVPQQAVEEFSKRRQQILAGLAAKGMHSARAAEVAALATRKAKELTRAELEVNWRATAAELRLEAIRPQAPAQEREQMASPEEILARLTLQASTFTPMQLAAEVHREAQGKLNAAQAQDYLDSLKHDPELVALLAPKPGIYQRGDRDEIRYTTREMLQVEQGLLDGAQARAADRSHAVDVVAALAARPTMSQEQTAALRHICQETGGVAVIEGMAGTGKSFLMGAARESWEAAGFEVRGAALPGKAADGLQEGAGIQSQTLHSLLSELDQGTLALHQKSIVVLDEAGMVGSRQLGRLLEYVHKAGAKAVLIGESQQLQPIDAGGGFRLLSQNLGAARLEDIRRQRTEVDRQMVRDFSQGKAAQALATLEQRGLLHAAETKARAMEEMVAAWTAERDPQRPGEALMLAGTRAEVRELNTLAREQMRAQHRLANEHEIQAEAGALKLAEGDRILFTKNSRALGVKNGTLAQIERIRFDKAGRLEIEARTDAGKIVRFNPEQYSQLAHGYAVSVHKAQGVTVDKVFVLASDSMTDREWSYVAASRHREQVRLFMTADQKEDMARRMSRSRQKENALDFKLAKPEQTTKQTVTQAPERAPTAAPAQPLPHAPQPAPQQEIAAQPKPQQQAPAQDQGLAM